MTTDELAELADRAVAKHNFTTRDLTTIMKANRRRIREQQREAAGRFRAAWQEIAETGRFDHDEIVSAIGEAARRSKARGVAGGRA